MTRSSNLLLSAIFIALLQIFVPGTVSASSNHNNCSSTILGFVFQDNDANGTFDDTDNIFATATVFIQKIGTTDIMEVEADNSGYFEQVDLSTGSYSVWASHYGVMSVPQVISVSNSDECVIVTLSISSLHFAINADSPNLDRMSDTDTLSVMLPLIVW